jgi:hypothetical protein
MRTSFTIVSVFLLGVISLSQGKDRADSSADWVVPPFVRDINQIKKQQFIAFDPQYEQKKADLIARLGISGKEYFKREAAGQKIPCAHEYYKELLWLISSTADFKRMDERLHDLELALAAPASSSDSSNNKSGSCLTEWWERLEWDYEHLKSDEPIPADILERINSPDKLAAYLTSVSVSDISGTGRDNGLEFNMAIADLTRWIVRNRANDKAFSPGLKETLLDLLLHQFQDQETGYWGQRYVIDGHEEFVPDLSTTFHIVSYLQGKVPRLDRIAATTVSLKDLDSPVGWLYKGQHYNHNCMDAVELFKWAWPQADEEQKQAMANAMKQMLDQCLTTSIQADGSFKHLEADQSIEEATYFGVEFLDRLGFFDKTKRFWTDEDFRQAEEIRERIVAFIEKHQSSGAAGGGDYATLLEELKRPTEGSANKQ